MVENSQDYLLFFFFFLRKLDSGELCYLILLGENYYGPKNDSDRNQSISL